jgi:hypothetical protein
MVALPVFETVGAYAAKDGNVSALEGAYYDFGGNHANDWLEFELNGKHFRYYHSSFGLGYRKCQPMDCMQVSESAGGRLIEDGCTDERTLPVVCVEIDPEESYYDDDDLVDNFEPCPT